MSVASKATSSKRPVAVMRAFRSAPYDKTPPGTRATPSGQQRISEVQVAAVTKTTGRSSSGSA